MYKVCSRKKWLSLILCFFLIFSLVVSLAPGIAIADDGSQESASPYEKIITDESGRQITLAIFPLPPPKTKVAVATVPKVHIAGAVNTLSNVPAFDWSYGCSATSAAMLFGYYDRIGYSNMYTGPANSGVCPLNNSGWGHTVWPSITCGESPINATHNGFDGRAIRGHVDDYWTDYESSGDPYVGNWTEHTLDCAGDYMGTNQWKYGSPVAYNTDGSTVFFWETNGDPLYDYTEQEPTYRDGCHGMRLFAQSRGYTVVTNFSQLIQGQGSDPSKGFTFANFQSEIDAGRPVLIQLEGHTMLGYGYNTSGNIIYIHDTWDYSDHDMIWGGTYDGLQHRAVTVIRLQAAPAAKLVGANDATATGNDDPNYFLLDKFTAEATGDITQLKLKCGSSGNVKVAIYANSSGQPGGLLNAVNTSTTVVSGWNQISITSTPVVSGTDYWLAVISDSKCAGYIYPGGTGQFKSASYSGFSFPSSAGSGFRSWAGYHLIAGWAIPLNITTTSLPNGTACSSYSQTLQAEGGSPPYSWSLASGSLPAGLTLHTSTGVISGTPSATGTSDFTAQLTDSLSATDTQALSITINSPPPPNITTTSLPDGNVGTAYSQTLQATGGCPPYSWSLTSGSLPAGLTLHTSTGVISGTPSATGTSDFTAQLTDSLSATDTQSLSITVTSISRLIGANDATATSNDDPNYFLLDKFTAEATGDITQLKLKCGSSGNVKVAIYANSSGQPGGLLNAVNTSTTVVSGWNQISITSTPVVSGTDYWLAVISDSKCAGYIYPGGTGQFKSASYSGFSFPSSAGSGFRSWAGYHLIAGWGAPPPPPDTAPALTSPGAFITFKWGTAERATTYWLQVNTQPDFGGTNIYNAEVGNVITQEVSGFSVGTTYYWRVKAGNASGWGPWSSVRSVLANTVP